MSQLVPDLCIGNITIYDVKVILRKLDQFKVSSPDGIPAIFYKNLSLSISLPLSILFNKSIQEGVFPSAWKTSNVTPVYKTGKKSDVCNYRPINILAAVSKVFERIIFNKVRERVHHVISARFCYWKVDFDQSARVCHESD